MKQRAEVQGQRRVPEYTGTRRWLLAWRAQAVDAWQRVLACHIRAALIFGVLTGLSLVGPSAGLTTTRASAEAGLLGAQVLRVTIMPGTAGADTELRLGFEPARGIRGFNLLVQFEAGRLLSGTAADFARNDAFFPAVTLGDHALNRALDGGPGRVRIIGLAPGASVEAAEIGRLRLHVRSDAPQGATQMVTVGGEINDVAGGVTTIAPVVVTFQVGAAPTAPQQLNVHTGWNWVSFNRRLTASDVASVLAPISARYLMVMGEEGTYLPPPNDPRLNTLTRFQEGKSYQIRLTQGSVLAIGGDAIPPLTPIQLAPGWRWVAYLRETPMGVATALGSIAGKYSLVLGETGTYLPPPGNPLLNTLQELVPGQGYLIRMTQAGTLTYPAAAAAAGQEGREPDGKPGARTQSETCQVINTPFFTHFFGMVTINGQRAPAGALIEAFSPRGDRVGCSEVRDTGQYPIMRVYGEDTSPPPIPGMRSGETVSFKVNGVTAEATGDVVWQPDNAVREVNLAVGAVNPTPSISPTTAAGPGATTTPTPVGTPVGTTTPQYAGYLPHIARAAGGATPTPTPGSSQGSGGRGTAIGGTPSDQGVLIERRTK